MISNDASTVIESFLKSNQNTDSKIKETPFGNIIQASLDEILNISPELFGKAVVVLVQRDYYKLETIIRYFWDNLCHHKLHDHLGHILKNGTQFIDDFEDHFLNNINGLSAGWGMPIQKLLSSSLNIFHIIFSHSINSQLSRNIKKDLLHIYLDNLKNLDVNKEAVVSDPQDFNIDLTGESTSLCEAIAKNLSGNKNPIYSNRQCCILLHLILMKDINLNEKNSESINEIYKILKRYYKNEILTNEFQHHAIPFILYHFVVKFDMSLNFIDYSIFLTKSNGIIARNAIKYLTKLFCTFRINKDVLIEYLHNSCSVINETCKKNAVIRSEEIINEFCISVFIIILCNQRSLLDNRRMYYSIISLPLVRLCLQKSRPLEALDKKTKSILMRVFQAYNLNWQSLNLTLDFEDLDLENVSDCDFHHLEKFGLLSSLPPSFQILLKESLIKRKFARKIFSTSESMESSG